jgi:uncharacterized protein (DUF305 family)
MKRKTLVVGAATLAALVTVGACGNTSTTQEAPSASVSAPSASATGAHNQADAMFTQHMIPHHQQAIEMSDMLLGKKGIDPRVMDLAKQIKAAQAPEIEQMQAWLTQWGMPTMPMMPGMDDMPGHSGMPSASATPSESGAPTHSMMPGMPGMSDIPGVSGMPGMDGMMSEEDMAALQNAQGVEAAKLYLTQMVKHHQGAITMAQNEIKGGQYPDTVALARSIVTSQQQEIDTMNKILASM